MEAASRLVRENPDAGRAPQQADPHHEDRSAEEPKAATATATATTEEPKKRKEKDKDKDKKHKHHHRHKSPDSRSSQPAVPSPAPAPAATPPATASVAATTTAATAMEQEGPPDIPAAEIRFDWKTDLIGSGSFGHVFRGTCCGKTVAVKVSKSDTWSEEQRAAIRAEVTIMKRIFHPNVVLFLGVSTYADGNVVIVSELMKTDLDHVIYDLRREAIPVEKKLRMLRDAALGCNWLHGICNIIHRDLKPANLLIDETERVKVADFGLSEFTKQGVGQDGDSAKGTPLYSAPEVLLRQPFDNSIDVYAFGLIMYEVMFERRIF
jgi:hypothetical protein